MAKRLVDVAISALLLAVLSPLLLLAAAGIRLSGPGPVLYRAERAGLHGRPFTMLKLRTMHVRPPGRDSAITGAEDARVFPVGRLLRELKLDEVPQLFNVLRGDMSLVGPRPEDPRLVHAHYTPADRETLAVRPGLASPGSLFYYTHGERLVSGGDPERDYVERVLPAKLAIERAYLRRASLLYDLRIMARTAWVLLARMAGRRRFPLPREAREAGVRFPQV